MTEMLYGSRFLNADLADLATGSRYNDDLDYDNVIEYTPRHLRAATLSRELQEALDAAFAPEPDPLPGPEPETVPLPEPVPTPMPVAGTGIEVGAENSIGYPIVPETVAYPSVLPSSAMPQAVVPETIFRDDVAGEPEAGFVLEQEPEFVPEPVFVLPVPAARGHVPTPEHTPVSPTPFPEREFVEKHHEHHGKKRSSRRGRRIRPAKVDVSRLMVPSPTRIANG